MQVEYRKKSPSAKLFYVCGTDHAVKCKLVNGSKNFGVVVVPREGDKIPAELPEKHVYCAAVSNETAGFSSTKVRNAMNEKNNDFLKEALSEKACKFLLDPTEDEKN